jgi:hypothetical protein
MLFNTKWEKPADVFSLESLIAWLEKQPAKKTYCYTDNGACLLSQYFRASGYEKAEIGGYNAWLEGYGQGQTLLPEAFSDLVYEHPRTFGAALKRAREFAERLS